MKTLQKIAIGCVLVFGLFIFFTGCNTGSGNLGSEGWTGTPTGAGISGSTTISGVITDQNSIPVGQAQISLTKSGIQVAVGTTDSNGVYLVSAGPGTYTAIVTKEGYAPFTQDVSLINGSSNALNAVISSSIGYLSGAISDNSGSLISGVQVQVKSVTTPTLNYSPITTGTTGSYKFTLASGTFGVSASKTGYSTGVATVTITKDIETKQDFTLAKTTGVITGIVTDTTGAPQKDVLVRLLNPGGQTLATETTTLANGKYTFAVTAGDYVLRASKTGWTYLDTDVAIVANVDLLKDIQLTAGTSNVMLQGTVKLVGTTQPISDISIYNYKDGIFLASTTSTATGTFFFTELKAGQYQLFLASGSSLYEPATYVIQILSSGVISPTPLELFLSAKSQTSSDIVQELANGTILDAVTKGPLEFVSCSLKGIGSIMSDAQGRFSFANLPLGTYELTFSKWGYSNFVTNFQVKATGTAMVNPDTYLLPESLKYYLNPTIDTDLGAIEGKFVDSGTKLGSGGLVLKIYTMVFVKQKIQAPGDTQPSTEVAYWAFLATSTPPVPIRTTWTGTAVAGSNEDVAGTFRLMNLQPNMYFDSGTKKWLYLEFKTSESGWTYGAFRYLVYISKGTNPTFATATVTLSQFNDSRDQGATKAFWWIENTSNSDRNYSWEVDVKASTTTFISNVDQPNF